MSRYAQHGDIYDSGLQVTLWVEMSVICTICARLVFPDIYMVHVKYCGQIDVSV